MKKLTIFSTPKPFADGHINIIQRNAIQSWLAMGPDVQVLLIGDEVGMPEVCAEFGVTQIANVARNQAGTPLVSAIFGAARQAAEAELLLFTNSDILFYPDTLPLALQVYQRHKEFVLMGQRYDLDLRHAIDFGAGWDLRLRSEMRARGHLHPVGGSDYFLFPRHLYTGIPDFAIGRAGWDNWMIYQAVRQPWLDIDATRDLDVVHQNHDYAHLTDGKDHQRHPETYENAELAGGMRTMYNLLDLRHRLVDGRVQSAPFSLGRVLRWLERGLQPNEMEGTGLRWRLLTWLRRARRKLAKRGWV